MVVAKVSPFYPLETAREDLNPDDLGFEFDEDLQAKEAAKPMPPTASELAKKALGVGVGGTTSGSDSDWDSELDDADIERVVMFVHTPDRGKKGKVEQHDRTAAVNTRQSKKLDWADQIDMELRHYERVRFWRSCLPLRPLAQRCRNLLKVENSDMI